MYLNETFIKDLFNRFFIFKNYYNIGILVRQVAVRSRSAKPQDGASARNPISDEKDVT